MNKKYTLVPDIDINATGLYRIKALRDFNNVKTGDLGGFVDNETNLSHEGNCWIYDDAIVRKSTILNNAIIRGKAIVENSYISDNVIIVDNPHITDSEIRGNAFIRDKVVIIKCIINNKANISGRVCLENSNVYDNCRIAGISSIVQCRFWQNVKINNNCAIRGVTAHDNVSILGHVHIDAFVYLYDNVVLDGSFSIYSDIDIKDNAIIYSKKDFIIFKNWWSSGRNFIWTRSNNMWQVGCFHGTGKELIKKAYKNSKNTGREYTRVVNYVEDILDRDKPKLVRLFNHIKRNIKLFI